MGRAPAAFRQKKRRTTYRANSDLHTNLIIPTYQERLVVLWREGHECASVNNGALGIHLQPYREHLLIHLRTLKKTQNLKSIYKKIHYTSSIPKYLSSLN
jgi:hypothetical protein